jgi:hypothetical protein
MEQNLLFEVNEIRKKMGLKPLISEIQSVSTKPRLILEEGRDDVIKVFLEYFGFSFGKNLDETRLDAVLSEDGIKMEIPKEGGGKEIVTCRSVDELFIVAQKAQAVTKDVSEAAALKAILDNNPRITINFANKLIRGQFDELMVAYVASRNKTRANIPNPTAGSAVANVQQTIIDKLNEYLGTIDGILNRVDDNLNESEVKADFYKENGDFKIKNELSPKNAEESASYFTNLSRNLNDKINNVTNLIKENDEFFTRLKNIVNKSGLDQSDITELNKKIDLAKGDCNTKLNNTKAKLEEIKVTSDEAMIKKAEPAREWFTPENPTAPDTQTNIYVQLRTGLDILAIPTKISKTAMYCIDKILKVIFGVFKSKKSKTDFDPATIDDGKKWYFETIGDRYKEASNITKGFFEDLFRMTQKIGLPPKTKQELKTWGVNLLNSFLSLNASKFSYDEVSDRMKMIIGQMAELSKRQQEFLNREPGFVLKRMTTAEYDNKMRDLMSELLGVVKNTSNKRVYDAYEGGKLIKKIQKLEDLAIQMESNLKALSDAKVEGAQELYIWYKTHGQAEGNVSSLMEMCRIMDEGAEKLNQKWSDEKTYTIVPFSMRDLVPMWEMLKNTFETKIELDAEGNVIKGKSNSRKLVELGMGIPREMSIKLTNLITYAHFTNIQDIKKIFAIYGPVRGALTLCLRETLNHTLLYGVIQFIVEGVFLLDRVVCHWVEAATEPGDQLLAEADTCVTNFIIQAYLMMGDVTGAEEYKVKASEINDRANAELKTLIEEDLLNFISRGKENLAIPLFNNSSFFAKEILTGFGFFKNDVDLYVDNELSLFEDTTGELFSDMVTYIKAVLADPRPDFASSEGKKLYDKWNKDVKRIQDTGYIYTAATGSQVAREIEENTQNDVKDVVKYSQDLQWFPTEINNDVKVEIGGGETIGFLDGFIDLLSFADEPTGEYRFKDGRVHNFEPDPVEGYSKHEAWAAEWFEENRLLGINDFINNKFYKFYPRKSLSLAELKNYDFNKKLNVINDVKLLDGDFSPGRFYFETPDGYFYDARIIDKVIPIETIKTLIKRDGVKRRYERAAIKRKEELENVEKTTGEDLNKLKKTLKELNSKIDEYEVLNYDEEGSSYFSTYVLARMMRDGTDAVCGDPYLGRILKKMETNGNKWCSGGKYYDRLKGTYVTYTNLQSKIDELSKKYSGELQDIENKYDKVLNESKKNNELSNIINEFIYKNKMFKTMKGRLNRNYLIETKRFDEDDYKHWKDTFKFQAVDEKNPGRYKDVKINMEDVMDRINHFRKKYDEDDAFVRAVVDTHENVVRFMFTKELANIKEGYEPVGFAKILMQLKEGRGEMEIWSVSRPASGNWFLVKGDFTPKELLGMDLEKIEPSDKEPKKKENPLDSLKKKENDANEKLKNNEKDGLNELPKNVQLKLKQKFGRGWTTEEPNEVMKDFYTKTHVTSVFGDDIEIYRLNANDEFFDYLQSNSSQVELKRGFCRSLYLAKNKEGITPQQKRVISHIINVCNNKFNNNLGLTIREPKK